MERIIKMLKIHGAVYLRREDVLSLIKEFGVRADSLNAKGEFNDLYNTLAEGIEDHNKIDPE
jgi:hypothetical protein